MIVVIINPAYLTASAASPAGAAQHLNTSLAVNGFLSTLPMRFCLTPQLCTHIAATAPHRCMFLAPSCGCQATQPAACVAVAHDMLIQLTAALIVLCCLPS